MRTVVEYVRRPEPRSLQIGDLPIESDQPPISSFCSVLLGFVYTYKSKMGNAADKVITGLYVGGVMGASKKEVMLENHVTHILTLMDNPPDPPFPEHFTYKIVSIPDSGDAKISRHFSECLDFIHQCRVNGGTCFVHCAAGISRAVTTCMMYIMTVSTLNFDEALMLMQYARRPAGPNYGFRMQLRAYHENTAAKERQRIKEQYPNSTLNDEEELRAVLAEAKAHFSKEGRPPTN